MGEIEVKVWLSQQARLPEYQGDEEAGADVRSLEDMILGPGEVKLIHTGIYMQIPPGYECQVRPRSGLALKYGVAVANSPGTIDSSYRGECNILLVNHSKINFSVSKGMRIGQFVFKQVERANFKLTESKEDLSDTDRGDGGFGHTGVN